MSSISSKNKKFSFGYKRINRQTNNLKSTAIEFQDYEDEQYTDFSTQNIQINKKRPREYVKKNIDFFF
jgi:hypothetical protein